MSIRPPFPAQHQEKPGDESTLTPKPSYEAPAYLPAGKLLGRNACVFFASPADSGYITGEVLTLLGGQTIA